MRLQRLLTPTGSDSSASYPHSLAHDHARAPTGPYDHLVPRNYLNNSRTDPAPFDFCPIFGPGDAIADRRGQFELLKSRLHLGTGSRVQRVLQKAMSGGAVTMSVLGGSGMWLLSSFVGSGIGGRRRRVWLVGSDEPCMARFGTRRTVHNLWDL
jgi:hypothetical protein